jgi:hypothetical protein
MKTDEHQKTKDAMLIYIQQHHKRKRNQNPWQELFLRKVGNKNPIILIAMPRITILFNMLIPFSKNIFSFTFRQYGKRNQLNQSLNYV